MIILSFSTHDVEHKAFLIMREAIMTATVDPVE